MTDQPATDEPAAGLAALARDRDDAVAALDERTAVLRAAVVRALECGGSEAAVAREAGVNRLTVRRWVGKA